MSSFFSRKKKDASSSSSPSSSSSSPAVPATSRSSPFSAAAVTPSSLESQPLLSSSSTPSYASSSSSASLSSAPPSAQHPAFAQQPTSTVPVKDSPGDFDLTHETHEPAPAWTKSIYDPANAAIIASYLCVGFTTSFLATPLSVYMVSELGAQPEEQNTINILMSVPWSFKLVYGFISDTYKLFGYRRKSYLLLGYVIYAACMLKLASIGTPDIVQLATYLFLGTVGVIMADVSADTMVVERSKYEPDHKKGQTQATCYSIRFLGGIIGSLGGSLLYNRAKWGWGLSFSQVCALCGSLPLAILIPAIPSLYELEGDAKSVRDQCSDIWHMVQLKAVWRPMAFIYIYNMFQTPNTAWNSYLQLTLHFPAWFLGFIALVGSVMTFAGIVAYKKYFFKSSWRFIYAFSSITTTIFSAMQLLLIFQINERYLGISNYPFAMGDDVLQQFLSGIQFLPSCVMYMGLCPKGSEGATYSMLTTFGNIALVVASSMGSWCAKIWDVSNDALRSHDLEGLWKLALLTSILPIFPLVFLRLLPKDQIQQKKLQQNKDRSLLGGVIFLFVLVTSLVMVMVNAVVILRAQDGGRRGEVAVAIEGAAIEGATGVFHGWPCRSKNVVLLA